MLAGRKRSPLSYFVKQYDHSFPDQQNPKQQAMEHDRNEPRCDSGYTPTPTSSRGWKHRSCPLHLTHSSCQSCISGPPPASPRLRFPRLRTAIIHDFSLLITIRGQHTSGEWGFPLAFPVADHVDMLPRPPGQTLERPIAPPVPPARWSYIEISGRGGTPTSHGAARGNGA